MATKEGNAIMQTILSTTLLTCDQAFESLIAGYDVAAMHSSTMIDLESNYAKISRVIETQEY
jgi:hypothetical protein